MAGLLGGVLPAIYSTSDQIKRQIYGLLTNPSEMAQRAGQSLLQSRAERQALMGQAFANPDRPLQVTNPQALAQLGQDVLTSELGIAPVGMIAYHGTPHNIVGKFDINKVGTGEGAQAFGHGMYFAEAPDTAKTYMTVGGKGDYVRLGDKVVPTASTEGQLLSDVTKLGRKAAINKYPEQADYIKTINPDNIKFEGGNLYKVDIPDEYIPKMLDWDKPLREQPELLKTLGFDVKKYDKLKAQREAMPEKFDIDIPEELAQYEIARKLEKQMAEMPVDISGKYFYEGLIKKYGNQKAISDALAEKGVKGIRYLDAGSRGKAAERSSNFVVFDPTDVKILERNDKPLEGLLD